MTELPTICSRLWQKMQVGCYSSKQDVTFLYAKGILAEEKYKDVRTIIFEALLRAETDELKTALERLTTIVEKGESTPSKLNMVGIR